MNRRRFLELAGAAGGLALWPGGATAEAATQEIRRHPLPRPTELRPRGLTLRAAPSRVDVGLGSADAWTLNGALPAPTLRLRRGETATMMLENGLPEETILHWHGLDVPEAADGHPRLAIAPGTRYAYSFEVRDRAGLYWYHPHTHMRTAPQTYQGMAGLLVVEDDEEAALELPSGSREIPLVLQDKRAASGAPLAYQPGMGPDMMLGYLGDTPFANGVAHATTRVARGTYRLRILNASNARIFDLGLSDGTPLTLIGSDGGLLPHPVTVDRITLATGERVDLLADFSAAEPGSRVYLRSFPFQIPGMMMGGMGMGRGMGRGRMGGMGGGLPQGAAMDLLELVVDDTPPEPPLRLPEVLSRMPERTVDADTPRRSFRFESMMMRHTINGRAFELERVDQRVPLGRTEIWIIENSSQLPHPVHIHAGQFRVRSRAGGRGRLMPWEAGPKDTVLVMPGERVELVVRFEAYRGLFLMHCHNLEHEDMGMMLNFLVE